MARVVHETGKTISGMLCAKCANRALLPLPEGPTTKINFPCIRLVLPNRDLRVDAAREVKDD